MNTASTQEKDFCVIWYAKTNSVTNAQRKFSKRDRKHPPQRKLFTSGVSSLKEKGASAKEKFPSFRVTTDTRAARGRSLAGVAV